MKLTLRDLFWLTLVAALACAWWVDRRQFTKVVERNKVLEHWLATHK